MKFKVVIDGEERQVEALPDGKLTLGGETLQATVGSPSADRRMVQVGDKTYEVRIVENCAETGIFVLEVAGERIPVTVSDVARSAAAAPRGAAAAAQPGPGAGAAGGSGAEAAAVAQEVRDGVWAPVPGKIVDVLVKAGDAVEEGTPVVILEAMKMENELRAPKKGVIASVLVKKGDSAEKGQLLVAFV